MLEPLLAEVLRDGVPGDVVEAGVYKGGTLSPSCLLRCGTHGMNTLDFYFPSPQALWGVICVFCNLLGDTESETHRLTPRARSSFIPLGSEIVFLYTAEPASNGY